MWNMQLTADTTVQITGRFISSSLSFIATVMLAKSLGGTNFGEYTKILAFVALFQVAVDFGLNQVFLKQHPVSYKDQFPLFLLVRCGFALILSLLASGGIIYLSTVNQGFDQPVVIGVWWGMLVILGYALNLCCNAIFQMQRNFLRLVAGQVIGALGLVTAAFFYFTKTPPALSAWQAMIVVIVGTWLNAFVSLAQMDYINFWKRFNTLSIFTARLFSESWPLGTTLLLNAILFRLDTFFLTTYRTSFEIGAYGLAYKFFELVLVVPTFMMNSLYPQLVGERNLIRVKNDLQQLSVKMFYLSLVGVVLLWGFAPILYFIKEDYASSVTYLRLLILSLPLFFLTSPLMWYYVLAGKQKYLLLIYGGGMLVNISSNWWLVPIYGATAAAITTGITEGSILFLGWLFFKFTETKNYA